MEIQVNDINKLPNTTLRYVSIMNMVYLTKGSYYWNREAIRELLNQLAQEKNEEKRLELMYKINSQCGNLQ